IRKSSLQEPGVIETEKCFVRKAGMTFLVDLHVVVNGELTVKEGHEISHNLKNRLLEQFPEITNILIHIEPNDIEHSQLP
ncbi:MAG TPA: cation transporter dimerization domain-containing protein, partial [Salinimicrobium sp.]|nr:cation transporter dimerization domain-containing protein [Salinimicrobium sp.]